MYFIVLLRWGFDRELSKFGIQKEPGRVCVQTQSGAEKNIRCRGCSDLNKFKSRNKKTKHPHKVGVSFSWCEKRDLNPYVIDTRPSNVRVYQFRHSRKNFTIRISKPQSVFYH